MKKINKEEKENIYIHKKDRAGFEIVCDTVCGEVTNYKQVTMYWKKVTCPECKEYEKIPLHRRNKKIR